MKPEELCVGLETARLLKDAGFPQDKSCFVWLKQEYSPLILCLREGLNVDTVEYMVSAPTTDEIMAMSEIPDDTFLTKHIDGKGRTYYAVTSLSNNVEGDIRDRAVEAAADYWLKVKG